METQSLRKRQNLDKLEIVAKKLGVSTWDLFDRMVNIQIEWAFDEITNPENVYGYQEVLEYYDYIHINKSLTNDEMVEFLKKKKIN